MRRTIAWLALATIAGASPATAQESRTQVLDRLKLETFVLRYIADKEKEEATICDDWSKAQTIDPPNAAYTKCMASLPPMNSSYCASFESIPEQLEFCLSYIVAKRKASE